VIWQIRNLVLLGLLFVSAQAAIPASSLQVKLDFCKISIPESMREMQQTAVFSFVTDSHGRPQQVKLIHAGIAPLDEAPFRACIADWSLKHRDDPYIAAFSMKYSAIWTQIVVTAKGFRRTLNPSYSESAELR